MYPQSMFRIKNKKNVYPFPRQLYYIKLGFKKVFFMEMFSSCDERSLNIMVTKTGFIGILWLQINEKEARLISNVRVVLMTLQCLFVPV